MKRKRKAQNSHDFNGFSRINADASARIEDFVRRTRANNHLATGDEILNNLGKQFGKASKAQLAGRVAEVQQAATFNADAAMKGMHDTFAATSPASKGMPHDHSDILIFEKGQIADKAQVKFYGTAEQTARQLSRQKYDHMQKIAPADSSEG